MVIDTLLPPTSHLPPIKQISSFPAESLSSAVRYLRRIYNPSVRGSRLRHRRKSSVSGADVLRLSPSRPKARRGSISTSSQPGPLHVLRTDAFERSYAIRWLISLISYLGSEGPFEESGASLQPTEALLQDAASLLAICAGTASAGMITRELVFALSSSSRSALEPASDSLNSIAVSLTDIPLENNDYGSVGAQTWGGACVMAEMIVDDPGQFGLAIGCRNDATVIAATSDDCVPTAINSGNTRHLRVLELGAGTGLVSLAAAKILQYQLGQLSPVETCPEVEVVATDYYPSVLANLKVNVCSNFPNSIDDRVKVTTHVLDWSVFAEASEPCLTSCADLDASSVNDMGNTVDTAGKNSGGNLHTADTIDGEIESELEPKPITPRIAHRGMESEVKQDNDLGSPASPFEIPFHVVLGADIIYEPEHAVWIKACLAKLLWCPGGSGGACSSSPSSLACATTALYEPLFHLIIPLRSTHAAESESIEKVFPFKVCCLDVVPEEARAPQLVIKSKTTLFCDVDNDREGDVVEYAYYKIGWCC